MISRSQACKLSPMSLGPVFAVGSILRSAAVWQEQPARPGHSDRRQWCGHPRQTSRGCVRVMPF
jgi:hypothetical protein